MRTVPRKKNSKIWFYKMRVQKWAQEAQALGLDPEQVTRMQARVDEAMAALREQQAAQMQARVKTEALHHKIEAMSREGASILRQIRARSVFLGPEAYTLGSISAPEKGSPIGEPGVPYRFTVELDNLGSLTLRWKCDHPRTARGTTYNIRRRLVHADRVEGPLEFLGVAGRKEYKDATLPRGAAGAIYEVQAIRSTKQGPVATHTVHLGFAGQGLPVPGSIQLAA